MTLRNGSYSNYLIHSSVAGPQQAQAGHVGFLPLLPGLPQSGQG